MNSVNRDAIEVCYLPEAELLHLFLLSAQALPPSAQALPLLLSSRE